VSGSTIFLVQAIILIGLPPGLWYYGAIKRFAPLVVVQIIVGILLGPYVLARIWPEACGILFPPESLAALNAISNLAVVLFAFTMGLHFDGASIWGRGRAFAMIGLGSVVTPTLIGVAMDWWMVTALVSAAVVTTALSMPFARLALARANELDTGLPDILRASEGKT
jgi:Kef-type K+ transport system membrane component KefB